MATSRFPNENYGPRIIGVTLSITILALITMIARLFVRLRMIRNVGWDDYVMIMATAICVAAAGFIIPEVKLGAGRHFDQIPPQDFSEALRLNFITRPMYLIGIGVAKISVGLFLLRIATAPFYRRTIISIIAFIGIYTFVCFFVFMFQCTNLALQWDPTAKGTCLAEETIMIFSYTFASFNILTDLLFAVVLPIPMLWHAQMNRRQKLSIISVLALGIFATVAALVKISYLPTYGKHGDWLWDNTNLIIWTVLENNVAIIAGNLSTLKPMFRSVLGSTYGRGSHNRASHISHPYGSGTGDQLPKNNYNSLSSSKERDKAFVPYSIYESHIMTTIGPSRERAASAISTRDEASGRNDSGESVVLLNDQVQSFAVEQCG